MVFEYYSRTVPNHVANQKISDIISICSEIIKSQILDKNDVLERGNMWRVYKII